MRPRWPLVREDDIQSALFSHLRWRAAPGAFFFHCPNGGRRDPVEAARFKALGARAGVPDVIIIYEGRCYALELKAQAGRLSNIQTEVLAALQRAGAFADVAYGLDAALTKLESWGLVRPARPASYAVIPDHMA
jgi:hypothetical protein